MTPELVQQIFEICIIPILGTLTVFAVNWIKAKTNSIKADTKDVTLQKYLDMLSETITKCVLATNQTYVATLKKQGKFDAEAQKKAFEKTYKAILSILNEDAVIYITEAVGDFDIFLTSRIEAEVNMNKPEC